MSETADHEVCDDCGCPLLDGCLGGMLAMADRTARPCPNRQARISERLLARAMVPELYAGRTVEGFRTDGMRGERQLVGNREACRSYVERFRLEGDQRTTRGILLLGPPGTGKTHLMAAVLQALIRRTGARGLFADFTTVCHDIQATFGDAQASEAAVLRPLIDAQVLALDELGARRPTPFVLDTLYLIINTRYSRRLPTLFSSNYHLAEHLDGAAVTRGRQLDRSLARPRAEEVAEEEFGPLDGRVGARIVSRLHEATEPPMVFDQADDYRRRPA